MGKSLQLVEALSPGQNLEAYVRSVSAIPILTKEEESELARSLFFDNDLDAARVW